MSQPLHSTLGSPRFVCLCAASCLMHLSLFALLPQWVWMAGHGSAAAACVPLAFFAGMVLPGPAAASTLERHSRKTVCLRSIAVLCAVPLLALLLLPAGAAVLPLVLLQGVAYGLMQISLGSTLVNDILPSSLRGRGDSAYAWAGRAAVAAGLLAGTLESKLLPTPQAVGFTLIPAIAALLLVAQTQIPVKAPVHMPRLSLDRFLLPSRLPLLLSFAAAPATIGAFAAADDTTAAMYALLFLGTLAAVPATRLALRKRWGLYATLAVGYAALAAGWTLALTDNTCEGTHYGAAALLCGAGAAAVSHAHLIYMLQHADHCQRGTAQNTYTLMWWLAFSAVFALWNTPF